MVKKRNGRRGGYPRAAAACALKKPHRDGKRVPRRQTLQRGCANKSRLKKPCKIKLFYAGTPFALSNLRMRQLWTVAERDTEGMAIVQRFGWLWGKRSAKAAQGRETAMKAKLLAGVAALVGLGALAAPKAEAALTLTVQYGATTILVTDNDPLRDENSTLDVIEFEDAGSGLTFTLDASTSSIAGIPSAPVLTIDTNGTVPRTGVDLNTQSLTVTASQDGLTSSDTNYSIAIDGRFTIPRQAPDVPPAPSATISYSVNGASITPDVVLTSTATRPFSRDINLSLGSVPTTPFTLTQQIVITGFGPGASFDVGSTISAVPEPMALALFGSGLVALGLARRRKPV